jgi:riboflavin biosynthesis pyrimidine reductase
VTAPKLLDVAGSLGARLVLCEGGPHLIGDLMGAGMVDVLFLTIAPQVAGRDDRAPRLGFVAGRAFPIAEAPWAGLVSVRRAADHLFLRYRLDQSGS